MSWQTGYRGRDGAPARMPPSRCGLGRASSREGLLARRSAGATATRSTLAGALREDLGELGLLLRGEQGVDAGDGNGAGEGLLPVELTEGSGRGW